MLIVLGALVAFLALMLILRTSTVVSEWMAANISRGWISVFSVITGIFPFSLYEFLLYLFVLAGITLIVTAIVLFCKKKALKAATYLLLLAIVGVGFGNVYTISAGFAYYRGEPDLPKIDAERLSEYDAAELISLAQYMIDDFNSLADEMEWDEDGRVVSPYSFKELARKIQSEYKRLDGDYYSSFTPIVKPITSKRIMSNMHLSGVFFAPLGEANVNPLTPACDMPVTMAHELAHSKGAMRESDANLTAYWLTVTSDNPYIRYSGYMNTYGVILSIASFFDSEAYNGLRQKLDPRIYKDRKLSAEFWAEYTLFDDITQKFNDFYLKLSGQNGTNSYVEPTKPPSTETKPSPDGGTVTEKFYNLNTLQKTLLYALKDRLKASDDEN